jgi:RNA polymerase sigma-70 factor (ECF subfamily)
MDNIHIEKAKNGDHNSFRYLVTQYKGFAFSLSYSIIKNNHLVEDVVQESFIKVYKGLHSFRAESSFKTWLGRIVINESIKELRKNKVAGVFIDEISESDVERVKDSSSKLLKNEKEYYISLVFEKMKPNESLSLELFYVQNNSIDEIQDLTGWSKSKTKMTLLRARKSFYSYLNKILKSEMKNIL